MVVSIAEMVDQPAHEGLAGCKLGDGDIFVRLVGLGDRAGAATSALAG